METHIIYSGKDLVVELCGEVDHHVSSGIRERIDYMLSECNVKKIIFDFSRVTFMDSSGIGIVLGRYNKIKAAGGTIAVRNAEGIVRQILEMSGVFKLEHCEVETGQVTSDE